MKRMVGWRYVSVESGAQSVMTFGIIRMHLLSAHNLDMLQKVILMLSIRPQ